MTTVALLLLGAVLAFAIASPRGLPEAVVAVPAALAVLVLGIVTPSAALEEVRALGPTVGFLAAILVLAHLADALGVFRWLATVLGRGSGGDPRRLLVLVFAAAALCTAVLNLDATVVLLTPAVLATAVALRLPPRPHAYASVHLANSASLLLPVSNLTNLLALQASGLTFLGFTALMALPWAVVVVLELAVFAVFFRRDLRRPAEPVVPAAAEPAPRTALVVLGLTLTGFAGSGLVGVEPVWVAVVGAAVLAVPAINAGATSPRQVLREASLLFVVFVLALGVVVAGVTSGPVGRALADSLPSSTSLLALLGTATLAAVLANVVNNLPATLVLLAALGGGAPAGLVLAVLLGVNIGPNLTYVGSLATLLWRRVLLARGLAPSVGTYTRLGLITVPLTLVAAVLALWVGLRVGGV
ncbi:SLC13 family permease [Rhodococcus antarcticus]|uniref:SLC13 family permease n=1 Tax=Rhodococcus antarcticus TaxID=2987751 RepID=A0ABY6NXG3_9NOCA|nr:ArsB/NhaD family transporter [Rhodococcus antarcticus]UZJ23618.1 SLC13 family permease [Rhodococcus antarcticus]